MESFPIFSQMLTQLVGKSGAGNVPTFIDSLSQNEINMEENKTQFTVTHTYLTYLYSLSS